MKKQISLFSFFVYLYLFIYNVLSPIWRGGLAISGEGGRQSGEGVRHFWRGLPVVFALVLCACSTTTPGSVRANSTADLPSVQETYRDRFSRTERGMSLVTFLGVWPEALKSGETAEYAVYEFRDSILYHTDADQSVAFWYTGKAKNHEYLQRVIFFFADGVLVKYETVSSVVEVNG